MSFLSIKDAPLKETIVGDEKIPTGGYGDLAITAQQLKDFTALSFSNVDNTADLDKPISTATQAALDLKANVTYVDTLLSSKTDKTYVDDQLALKASKIYVDSALANKTHNSLIGRDVAGAHPASAIADASGKTQQYINDLNEAQLLTTEQFPLIIPEVDDTGRLQRAFDASFDKQQTLHLVGDFNCSDTLYARHNFNGSSSTITFPLDYNKDALTVGAEKSVTTTRMTGKVIHFPNIETTKTSGTNDWTSNTGSCAIKIINPQECKMWFSTTVNFEYGVSCLAYNTDANYNQYNFGRHVFHKRPMTFHVDGSISVASMNQNTLTGGRFAASNAVARVIGVYLMHFLITGGALSSLNNNLILNPSVEGSADEYAMLFESQGTNISGLAYNTIIAPRLETGGVAGKKMAFRGDRVRWNRVMQGYGVEYDSVVNENGATVNTIFGSTGAMQFIGSLSNTAVGSFQNNSGVAFPTFAVYATGKTSLEMMDATTNSVLYATSTNLYSRSATAKRWSLSFGNGKQEWFNASEALLANLYAETGGLKSDYRLSLAQGIGVFGTIPPSSKRSITGKKTPTTITEQNAVIDSMISALAAYGLVSDDRIV